MGERKWLWIGGIGAGIAALCCFTPIAVIALGVVGAGAAVAWLDMIRFPALFLFGALFAAAWIWRLKHPVATAGPSDSGPATDTAGGNRE